VKAPYSDELEYNVISRFFIPVSSLGATYSVTRGLGSAGSNEGHSGISLTANGGAKRTDVATCLSSVRVSWERGDLPKALGVVIEPDVKTPEGWCRVRDDRNNIYLFPAGKLKKSRAKVAT
jgi:hypothetical protein